MSEGNISVSELKSLSASNNESGGGSIEYELSHNNGKTTITEEITLIKHDEKCYVLNMPLEINGETLEEVRNNAKRYLSRLAKALEETRGGLGTFNLD